MSHKTKRQQQISKLSRKKGHYVSQLEETGKTVSKAFEMKVETIKEDEVDKAIEIENENKTVNYWIEEDLKEFEEIENRLITKALHWHENVTSSIRAAYIKDSRTKTEGIEIKRKN